ncbi:MAG: hypothetical protein P8P90_01680 [Opitutales bacterium]|nr:hypothetical protein [Opitutales bacterium]
MPAKKTKQKAPELYEYRFSFKVDERSTIGQRHYLAHNARDALGMFAYAMLKSLFDRKIYQNQEFIIAKEFVKIHDTTVRFPKFEFDDPLPSNPHKATSGKSVSQSKDSPDKIKGVVEEMAQRLEIIKFEEFNRWADRWYPLRLPLEEIKEDDDD